MARFDVNQRELSRFLQGAMRRKAVEALSVYRREPLEKDRAGYPFDSHPGDRSIRDKRSASVRDILNGVQIIVASQGAPFIEGGNDGKGSTISSSKGDNLAIPVKKGVRGRVVVGPGGRLFFLTKKVRSYKGRRLLERSIFKVFGFPFSG